MRHVRLLGAVIAARFRGPLEAGDESRLSFRVWPTDVDVSIANHAAVLTIMEVGRIDFMIRSGFFRLARRNHWYFPLHGVRVRYVRPLKMLQRGTLTTRLVHADDEVLHVQHSIRSGGKDVAIALATGSVKHGRDRVPLARIADELGVRAWPTLERDAVELVRREDALLEGLLRRSDRA